MLHKKKKPIIFIAVICLVFSLFPLAASADSEDFDENTSEGAIVEDDDNDGVDVVTKPIKKNIQVFVKADGRSRINVTWTMIPECKGYDVYRSNSYKKIGCKVFSTSNKRSVKFLDKKAKINKTWYYTVKPRPGEQIMSKITEGPIVNWTQGTSIGVKNKLKFKKKFKVKAYAYTGGGYTASGKKAKVGRIAVDPKVIKMGTWVYVEGYGLAQACDIGGSLKGKKIDVYLNSEAACYRWGIKHPRVYILK